MPIVINRVVNWGPKKLPKINRFPWGFYEPYKWSYGPLLKQHGFTGARFVVFGVNKSKGPKFKASMRNPN